MQLTTWGADEWNAFAQVFLAFSLVLGGVWGFYTYNRSQRASRGQWLNNLFIDFYVKDTFKEIRTLFEYEYDITLGPLIQQRLTNRDIPLTDKQVDYLRQLDTLLNYFENLLYLEESGLLKKADRLALFEYWFDLLKAENRGGIRRYINLYGWEKIAQIVGGDEKNFLFLYGTLQEGEKGYEALNLKKHLKFVKTDSLSGKLYDLGEYPGAKIGSAGEIYGRVYEVENLAVFEPLDDFERFDPADADNSLFMRKCVTLRSGKYDVWVYEYNQDVGCHEEISSGRWAQHRQSKAEIQNSV